MNAKLEFCGSCLEIVNFSYYPEEENSGNPYNTSFDVKVVSGLFSGYSEYWEYDHRELAGFISQLEELAAGKINEVILQEIGVGQQIHFEGDGLGHITVRGTINSDGVHSQSLSFEFVTDQTVFPPFISQLKEL